MLKQLLSIAEVRAPRDSFDAILALGARHGIERCVRLNISIANYYLEGPSEVLEKGVSARCESGRYTPIQALFGTYPIDEQQATRSIKFLVDAGARVRPADLLQSIRDRNYSLMTAALKFIDPNFGLNQQTNALMLANILNPLILVTTMADEAAVKILLEAGASVEQQVNAPTAGPDLAGSKTVQYSIREYGKRVLYELFRRFRTFPRGGETTEKKLIL